MRKFWQIGVLAIAGMAVALGCLSTRSDLPMQSIMVRMTPAELERLVLSITPLGTPRSEVEKALDDRFRRQWELRDVESVEYMSNQGFDVPVSDGDYYLTSDFAEAGWPLPRIVTVKFLFDQTGMLKDVSATVWDETI